MDPVWIYLVSFFCFFSFLIGVMVVCVSVRSSPCVCKCPSVYSKQEQEQDQEQATERKGGAIGEMSVQA